MTHEEALDEYRTLLETHISKEFKEAVPKVMDLMIGQMALDVFVPKTWTGIKTEPLVFGVLPGMPKHMKPKARPINPRIYEPVNKEFDRMMTYFYVKSESTVASLLVVAPKATKPYIRMCGDYPGVNVCLKMPQHPMPNVRYELEKCRRYIISLDMDTTNSYYQFPLSKESSELLSVQTPWGLFRPLYMPEGCSPAQGVLMTFMKEAFIEYEDWMIVLYDNILVLANTFDEAYEKLELVLKKAAEYNIILKMAKTWLGYRTVKFFGYEITHGSYELGKERKEAIQAIEFPKNQKGMQSFLGSALYFKDLIPNFADHTAPLHDMTHKNFNWDQGT